MSRGLWILLFLCTEHVCCILAFNYSAVPRTSLERCAMAHAALKPRLD